MGRKKIAIEPITSAASRRATFEKRRIGLFKKAMELSILCGCKISVTIEQQDEHNLQIYSSEPYEDIIDNYQSYSGEYKLLTNDHLNEMVPGKPSSSNVGYNVIKTATKHKKPQTFEPKHLPFHDRPVSLSQAEIVPDRVAHANYHPMRPSYMNHMNNMNYGAMNSNSSNYYKSMHGISNSFNNYKRPILGGYSAKRTFNMMQQQKRSFAMHSMEPPTKRMRVNEEENSNDTSQTSTIELSLEPWNASVEPVEPLELFIEDDDVLPSST